MINQTKEFLGKLSTGLNNLKKKPNNLYPLETWEFISGRLTPLKINKGSSVEEMPLAPSKISNYCMIP